MFLIHRTSNDRTLSVPVGQQLYGLLACAISQGDMPSGERLPSGHDLASKISLAPMSVREIEAPLHAVHFQAVRAPRGSRRVSMLSASARPAPPAPASKNDRKNRTERPFSRGP